MASVFLTANVKAQTTAPGALRLGIGADAGLPTGNLKIGATFVLGGTVSLQYGLSDRFAITLTSGADHFFPNYIAGTHIRYNSFGIIPVKAGFKAFFSPSVYFGAEAGIGIEQTNSGSGNKKFLVSPALGWANQHWDLSFRYDNYSGQNDPYGFVALRIAYGFGL